MLLVEITKIGNKDKKYVRIIIPIIAIYVHSPLLFQSSNFKTKLSYVWVDNNLFAFVIVLTLTFYFYCNLLQDFCQWAKHFLGTFLRNLSYLIQNNYKFFEGTYLIFENLRQYPLLLIDTVHYPLNT